LDGVIFTFQLTVAAAWDNLGILILRTISVALTTSHHSHRGGCVQWTQMWPQRWQFYHWVRPLLTYKPQLDSDVAEVRDFEYFLGLLVSH
jgi:hypothetical protein